MMRAAVVGGVLVGGCIVAPMGPTVGPPPPPPPQPRDQIAAPGEPPPPQPSPQPQAMPAADDGAPIPLPALTGYLDTRAAPVAQLGHGCFAGFWQGAEESSHHGRASFRINLVQRGNRLHGVLVWMFIGMHEGTEEVTGTADCAAGTATLRGGAVTGEASPSSYAVKLGPAGTLTSGGTELLFEGTYGACGDDCDGTVRATSRTHP